ncbi:MAG: type II toxin-antitoxin system RelE family toxin [Bacteriovorax sp.]
MIGLLETRKIADFYDEPLKGNRMGQRSIRFNRAYRAIYKADEDQKIVTVTVIEVHKHDY